MFPSDPWPDEPLGTRQHRLAQVLAAAGDAVSPAGIGVQPLENVQRAGIQPSQSKQRNVPEPVCRAKEKRSARVVEWEEGE